MKRLRVLFLIVTVSLFTWIAPAYGEEPGDSLFGYYSEPYYVNEYFGFQMTVPYDYSVFKPDSDAATAISEGKAHLEEYDSVSVFDGSRQYVWDNIKIEVYSPEDNAAYLVKENGIFGEEQENAEKYAEYYRSTYESYESYTDVAVKVDRLDFAGGSHPAALFKFTMNMTDGTSRNICQMDIFLRSPDSGYLCIITLESDDPLQMETMCGYFSQYGGVLPADPAEGGISADDLSKMELTEDGKLHVGIAPESPVAFRNEDGTYSGAEVEVLQKIAEKLSLELVLEEPGYENLLSSLQAGSLDVITTGFEEADKNEAYIRYTQPFYTVKEREESVIHITIYQFAVSMDCHFLYAAVNGALLEMLQDGTVDGILSRYLG